MSKTVIYTYKCALTMDTLSRPTTHTRNTADLLGYSRLLQCLASVACADGRLVVIAPG